MFCGYIRTGGELLREGAHRPPASSDGRKVRALSHGGEYAGVGEPGIEKELDKVVQFERFGFVRIDSADEDGIVAYFTHK